MERLENHEYDIKLLNTKSYCIDDFKHDYNAYKMLMDLQTH